jgi:hypothetical protein
VPLIFMLRFFKDIAELDDIGKLTQLSPEVLPVSWISALTVHVPAGDGAP